MSGFSAGINAQLNHAPSTGIRNFHVFSTDTLTVGLESKVYQMVMAAADKNDSHPSER
jgi:hypothetical protein